MALGLGYMFSAQMIDLIFSSLNDKIGCTLRSRRFYHAWFIQHIVLSIASLRYCYANAWQNLLATNTMIISKKNLPMLEILCSIILW